MKSRLALVILAFAGTLAGAHAAPDTATAGQKIDSGLGSLPHYSQWLDKTGRDPMGARVVGESLDDGLGNLPHYSKWVDPTGRDPMGVERTVVGLAR